MGTRHMDMTQGQKKEERKDIKTKIK